MQIMKKMLFLFALLLGLGVADAQKIALVDMDYILKKDPAYESPARGPV